MIDQMIAFLEEFQQMRSEQKEYFATKKPAAMYRAKSLEKQLDDKAEKLKQSLQFLNENADSER